MFRVLWETKVIKLFPVLQSVLREGAETAVQDAELERKVERLQWDVKILADFLADEQ